MSVVRYKNSNTSYLPSKAVIQKLQKAGRSPLVLGRRLQIDRKGRNDVGLEFYYPDPNPDNVENLFNYGQSGSGKTWGMMNLVGQSYWFEKRTWVIIDSKGSVSYDTLVYVRINGREQVLSIGEIIDRYIPDSHNTHEALDITDDLYVLSLGNDHKLQWKPVRQVSKHRATDKVLKFTTRSGREIISTKNHSFVMLQNGKYQSIRGDKLKIGDYIPVSYETVFLKTTYGDNPQEKYLIDVKDTLSVVNYDENAISLPLAYDVYEDLRKDFPKNAEKLKLMLDGDVWWDAIKTIEEIESPSEFVYDFAVKDTENFMLANGMVVHNSYLGNHLPNDEYKDELKKYGLRPMGIPKKYMVVTAPEYYINGLSNQEIEMDQITDSYRIPISMANIPILFSITKLNPNTMYSSSYDMNWKKMMARTRRRPKKVDLYNMLNEIMIGQNNTTARWYETLINKIRDAEDLTLTENSFSPVGKALLQSAYDHKPRWIVVTFKHADASADSINLAIYAAVLEEVRRVTTIVKRMNFDLRVGLYVDEMQYYLRDTNTPAYQQTVEAIYRWGRSNRLFRVWGTQTNRHLDPLLQDDIRKFDREGTYQKVIHFTRIGGPGYCTYMDRQRENAFDLEAPYYAPLVKTPPPMFKIMEL